MFEDIIFKKPKNGQEIANELGCTRMNVSQILKRALRKVYKKTKKLDKEFTPFDTTMVTMEILNIKGSQDINNFFNLFPSDIRKEIKDDAKKRFSSIKK